MALARDQGPLTWVVWVGGGEVQLYDIVRGKSLKTDSLNQKILINVIYSWQIRLIKSNIENRIISVGKPSLAYPF